MVSIKVFFSRVKLKLLNKCVKIVNLTGHPVSSTKSDFFYNFYKIIVELLGIFANSLYFSDTKSWYIIILYICRFSQFVAHTKLDVIQVCFRYLLPRNELCDFRGHSILNGKKYLPITRFSMKFILPVVNNSKIAWLETFNCLILFYLFALNKWKKKFQKFYSFF